MGQWKVDKIFGKTGRVPVRVGFGTCQLADMPSSRRFDSPTTKSNCATSNCRSLTNLVDALSAI